LSRKGEQRSAALSYAASARRIRLGYPKAGKPLIDQMGAEGPWTAVAWRMTRVAVKGFRKAGSSGEPLSSAHVDIYNVNTDCLGPLKPTTPFQSGGVAEPQ
jgi:hypothetical protein